MKAGTTGIRAADNMKGYYCGTCHNGVMMHANRKIFKSCSKTSSSADMKTCERCHSQGKNALKEFDFSTYTEKFPKERFGNNINWEKAEADGLIKLVDEIEGVSIKRPSLAIQKDFTIDAKVKGMPEIVFSHKKHTVWNGCEVCHPEIFAGVKKGTTKYTMAEIFEGKYCGVCHSTVAFPLLDCQRCHTKQVQ
jgi:c(7)-type cytochrome triheme protein